MATHTNHHPDYVDSDYPKLWEDIALDDCNGDIDLLDPDDETILLDDEWEPSLENELPELTTRIYDDTPGPVLDLYRSNAAMGWGDPRYQKTPAPLFHALEWCLTHGVVDD